MARNWAGAFATLVLLTFAGVGLAEETSYHVIKQIPVGGQGGWDYLSIEPESRLLFISRATRVQIMDLDKEKIVGEVPNTPGVHGIALAPKMGRGYSSNGRESTVTVIDLKTFKEIDRIKVGKGPDAIIYDSATNRVFTFNAASLDSTAIDCDTNKVAGTVKLGGRPEFAASDEKGTIFVNLEDKSKLVAFDAKELTVKNTWPLEPGKAPAGLAIDCKNRRLFSTCHNEMMVVVDADTGKVVATPKIGKGTDAAAFDPETGLAFSSNGEGTLTIIAEKGGEYQPVQNVKTKPTAKTMALDPKTHNIYLGARINKDGSLPKRGDNRPSEFVILVVGK